MYLDDTGIVLQTVRYDDASSVAHLFTRSSGHASFMVSRPRSRTSQLAGIAALTTPLNILSFQWDRRANVHLSRMKDVRALHVWQGLPTNPVKTAVALLLGEFLLCTLREEGVNEPLFDYIDASLQWYDAAADGYANFHLVFLLKITRFLGIAPDVSAWTPGSSLELDSSSFIDHPFVLPDREPFILTPTDTTLLMQMLQTDYSSMAAIPLTRHDRARLLAAIERYYILHIPGFPPLKSPAILSTLFD
jgi:Recombinational DNA repair protein (RecF pathway)